MFEMPVLFEDEFILAVDKPPGLPTQAGHDPRRPNLYSMLQEKRGEKLFLHHRLDKDTSGVLILGRHPKANKGLTDLFRDHRLQKTYWAITKPGKQDASQISVSNHLAPVRGSNKQLMRMVKVKSGGWKAETSLRRLEKSDRAELWEALPKTGRTHQIRVHLAGTGRPILGDFLYGGKSSEVPRLLLHAKSLSFQHPVTGADLLIEAPIPKDFSALLEKFRRTEPS